MEPRLFWIHKLPRCVPRGAGQNDSGCERDRYALSPGMSKLLEEHEPLSEKKYGDKVQPIFISCDPARDTDEALRKYLAGG